MTTPAPPPSPSPTEAQTTTVAGLPEPDLLVAWLVDQRWYATKGLPAEPAGSLVVTLGDDPPLHLVIAGVRVGDEVDAYQLLVGGDPATGLDALDDPLATRALFDRFAEGHVAQGGPATVAFHWVGDQPAPTGDTRRLGGEQSNTSIVVGDEAIVKVLRRLHAGESIEVEMLRFLTERHFPYVPALAGWYDLDLDGDTFTLGVAQAFVADGRDGWGWVLDGLADDPGGLLGPIRTLGRVVAELHRVLASAPDVAGFAPQPATPASLGSVAERIERDARRFVGGTADGEPDADAVVHLAECLAAKAVGGKLIRHHGDLHLGQTLVTPRGWAILDFEGEPARPLRHRRSVQSPLRDVAGLLRSLAYAVATYERATGDAAPGWEPAARAALLDGYLAVADPAVLPGDPVTTHHAIALFELEKVVYELGYEQGNRPDWVDIPTAGLRRLLDRGRGAAA
ncbi:MAG TPA: hypothetical protein VGM93_15340 [Acidimicrobiales bacterium]